MTERHTLPKKRTLPDCWYIHFDRMIKVTERERIADWIAKKHVPGCFLVHHSFYNPPTLESMGGGKSGAHQKRRVALKYPDRDWVYDSIFVVREQDGSLKLLVGETFDKS